MDDNRMTRAMGACVDVYSIPFPSCLVSFLSSLRLVSLAGMGSRPWEGYSLSVSRVFPPLFVCL